MAFRFFPPGIQFFTNDGQVLAGGSLTFSDSGTTDPRPTYSDPELSTPNSNPVELDGAGRPNTDIWGDGSYRVVLKDSLGATIATLDNVSGPQGIPDPALQAGKFLSNDGTDIFWIAIREVPDPDGASNGDVLTTDGAGNMDWQPTGVANIRQVPDPSGVTDGWVLTRDDEEESGYKWEAIPSDGVTRVWSDQTSNRTLGASYQNETDVEIEVSVICKCKRASAGGQPFVAQCDSVTVGTAAATGSTDCTSTITFTVPPGKFYSVSSTNNNGFSWAELRPPE